MDDLPYRLCDNIKVQRIRNVKSSLNKTAIPVLQNLIYKEKSLHVCLKLNAIIYKEPRVMRKYEEHLLALAGRQLCGPADPKQTLYPARLHEEVWTLYCI